MAEELMDVTMPDGTVITDVPAGTTQAQLMSMYGKQAPATKKPSIFGAMKEGAKQTFSPEAIEEYSKQISPTAAARMAAPVRFATGVARIPANLMSWAGINEPLASVKAAEEGAKQLTQGAGYKGMLPGAANIGGELVTGGALLKGASMAAPFMEAVPGGAAIVKGLRESPSGQAILGGMGLGAAGSTGTPQDILKEAGLGGLFGLGGQTAASAVGHVAAPVLERYRALKNAGYTDAEILKDTTIGQFFGGATQKLERVLEDIPFGGVVPKVTKGIESLKESLLGKTMPIEERAKTAQNLLETSQKQAKTLEERALENAKTQTQREMEARHAAELEAHKATGADIHVPVINYALEPLGIKVPQGMVGNAAQLHGQKAISNAYNESLAGMSNMRLNKTTQDELRSLADDYSEKYLGKENAELFKNDIERLIGDTTKGKWLTPDNWQRNLSQLSKEAHQMRQKDPRYSQALYDLKDKWMDLIENQVGGDLFKAANTAFSRFKVPEKASTYAKSIKAEGQFEPSELINALKSELSTKRLAGGEDTIQQLAVKANKDFVEKKKALEAAQQLEKQNFNQGIRDESRALEDRFVGMDYALAQQKAALKKQAEKGVGAQEAMMKDVAPKDAGDYAGKRIGYAIGTGGLGLGSYGLAHALGMDPLWAAAISGGAIGGTRGLYSSPLQTWLKETALKQRPAAIQKAGEVLRQRAPLAGLAAAQQAQSMRGKPGVQVFNPDTGEEITPPKGGLDVPQ